MRQCEDFLGLAGWLLLKEPEATYYGLRSQLARLFGQLHAVQVRRSCRARPQSARSPSAAPTPAPCPQNHHGEALRSFSEDAYHCAMEFGPEDMRTSVCYFNLGKVFQAQGERVNALACNRKARRV